MTLTPTLIDNLFFANNATGTKSTYWSLSFTNPYTAGGETLQLSTAQTGGTAHFSRKFLGGTRMYVNPSVTAALAGIGATAAVRGDTSSYLSCVIQMWANGLSGTSSAGLPVDNTTANISGLTIGFKTEGY